MSASIVFTGGGTAGHVTPNIALIHELRREGWTIAYVGSADGVEKSMIEALGIAFYPVKSGKLRRYFSLKTLIDPFKILVGIFQCTFLLYRLKPDVVFSKGGFVAFPVVVGAWLNRIPVVAHESDMSPGLTNRLCFPFVTTLCLTFDAGKKHFKQQDKIKVTGTPIREELFNGIASEGLKYCGFNSKKPCLLVMGGSLGAGTINRCVREALAELTSMFQVIHLCGKGKLDLSIAGQEGYCQLEYANEELGHLLAASSLIISRSGANSLYELLALGKPHVLIPLSGKASRGDQIQNAHYFEQAGISVVIADELLNSTLLLKAIRDMMPNLDAINEKIKALQIQSATSRIIDIIKEQTGDRSSTTV